MKKIIIELEDSVYKKLQEMTLEIKKRFKDVEITPEMLATELIVESVTMDEKLKTARDNMAGMLGDFSSMNTDEMLNNLLNSFTNLNNNFKDKTNQEKNKENETKKQTKTSNDTKDIYDEDEDEFKS